MGEIIYSKKEACPHGKENCLRVIIKEYGLINKKESFCTLLIEAARKIDETKPMKKVEEEIFGRKVKKEVPRSIEERLQEVLKKFGCPNPENCEYRTGKIHTEYDLFSFFKARR